MRFRGTRVPLPALLLLAALAGACGDEPVAPGVATLFRVQVVNGHAVPFTEVVGDGCTLTHTGGWLRLEPGGRYQAVLREYQRTCDGVAQGVIEQLSTGTFTLDDDSVRFSPLTGERPFAGRSYGDQARRRGSLILTLPTGDVLGLSGRPEER